MTTCKDCLHSEVCAYIKPDLPICSDFADRSKYVVRENGEWIPLGQRTYGGGRCYTHYCNRCRQHGYDDYVLCPNCGADMTEGTGDDTKVLTNADRIRAMSDEELAEFLTHINPTNCQDCEFSHGWCCHPDRDDYSDFKKCEEGRKRWLQQTPKGE